MLLSNGAVAGALMGCKFGFKKLPEDLLNFPHRKWLDRKIQQFLVTIGLGDDGLVSEEQKNDELKEQEMDHSASDDHNTSVPNSDTAVVHCSDDVIDLPSDEFTTPPSGGDGDRDGDPSPSDDNVVTSPNEDVDKPPANPPDENVTNSSDNVTTTHSNDVISDDVTAAEDGVTNDGTMQVEPSSEEN